MLPETAGEGYVEEKITPRSPPEEGELKASIPLEPVSSTRARFKKSGAGTEGVSKCVYTFV